jgi:hypothetical protein
VDRGWTGVLGNPRGMCAFIACHARHRCRSRTRCGGAWVLIIRGWEFQGWAAGTAMFAVTTHPDHHVQKAEEGHRLGMLSGSWLTGCLKQLYRVTARLDLGRHVTTSRLHWKCKTRILRLENTRGPPKRQLRAIP